MGQDITLLLGLGTCRIGKPARSPLCSPPGWILLHYPGEFIICSDEQWIELVLLLFCPQSLISITYTLRVTSTVSQVWYSAMAWWRTRPVLSLMISWPIFPHTSGINVGEGIIPLLMLIQDRRIMGTALPCTKFQVDSPTFPLMKLAPCVVPSRCRPTLPNVADGSRQCNSTNIMTSSIISLRHCLVGG